MYIYIRFISDDFKLTIMNHLICVSSHQGVLASTLNFTKLLEVENGDVVGICVSGGLDSKTVALRLRLAGVKVEMNEGMMENWWQT